MATNWEQEDRISNAWRALQVLHTPFRMTERAQYRQLMEDYEEVERLFIDGGVRASQHADAVALTRVLARYYDECFLALRPPEPDAKGILAELAHPNAAIVIQLIASRQTRLMEDAYFVLQLYQYANAPENKGWMNLFRRWGRSPTFNRLLAPMRPTFKEDFLVFYDLYVAFFPGDIETTPVPHPWDRDARRADPRVGIGRRRTGKLPGIYLDSGIREVGRNVEGPLDAPGTGAQGIPEPPGGESAPGRMRT